MLVKVVTDWLRTDRDKERHPSMAVTYSSIRMVGEIADESDKVNIITNSSCDGADCEWWNVFSECVKLCKKRSFDQDTGMLS